MAGLTMADKSKSVMKDLLLKKGWNMVGELKSLVMVKNNVYLVMYPNGEEFVPKTEATGLDYCGYESVVHATQYQWYLTSDGFMIANGSVGRKIKDAYDFGIEGDIGKPAVELAEKIDAFSEKSKEELLALKMKERVCSSGGASLHKAVPDSRGIGTTRCFVVDTASDDRLLNFFSADTVYLIQDINQVEVTITPYAESLDELVVDKTKKIPLQLLIGCEERGLAIAVSIVTEKDSNQTVVYESITSGVTALDESFDDLKLSNSQKAVLSEGIAKGVNFTPLMDNRLSPAEMIATLKLLEDGADGSVLVGKKIPEDNLKFMVSLTDNKLPINLFVKENATADYLSSFYSDLAESVDYRLKDYAQLPKFAKDEARYLAFQQRDISPCLNPPESRIELELRSELGGRFNDLAELMLKDGIQDNGTMMVSWLELTEEQKSMVLEYFKSPGMKLIDYDFGEYLEKNRNNFLSVWFFSNRSFALRASDFYFYTDYNSVFAKDTMGKVLWRSVYVNEKYYTYVSPTFSNWI